MKTSIRKTLIPAAAAFAVAVPTVLASPAFATGNAADARYEAYVAQEKKDHAAKRTDSRATQQVTRVGASDTSTFSSDNGAKRFYLEIPTTREQHYRGM